MCLLSECEHSSWSSYNVNQMVTLLSSLIYSHLEVQGCPQQAGPCWANGKVQSVLVTNLLSAFYSLAHLLLSYSFLPVSITNRHNTTFCLF